MTNEIKQLRLIGETFKASFIPFLNLLLVIFIIYYVYGVVGDRFVGGKIANNDIRYMNDPALPDNFVLMNMNDLIASFITLFALMVVNNWYVTTLSLTTGYGSTSFRWFSITFYFIILTINILLALVLDMYA